jgi:polyphosphate kinase 2
MARRKQKSVPAGRARPMDDEDDRSAIGKSAYRHKLRALQIELVKLQKHIIEEGLRVLVIVEGRDAAGKDGLIKRIVQHASPRETRVVALGKPSDREESEWYFQRFVPHLPAACELVLFNRSWYNRAGVERIMGFCSEADYKAFMDAVCPFEDLLVRDGILLFKYYLDISRAEQAQRLKDRRTDPLKQWKRSPVDDAALKHWDDYSKARDAMLMHTCHRTAAWTIVRADDKRVARLNAIADLLSRLDFRGKDGKLARPNRNVVFPFSEGALERGALAP